MSALLIRVLGPIEAEVDQAPVHLTKPRHREIIGILAAAHGAPVSTSMLIDELWEDAPSGAVGAVRTFIGELRKLLEPDRAARTPPTVVVTVGDGYALRLDQLAVDLWRAEQLIQAAASAEAQTAESLLSDALAEWRGSAFDEFATRPWTQHERARITELRAGAVEQLADVRLRLDQPQAVLALLDAHIIEHPWREAGWRLLALALYRSERQGDALAVLARARSSLVDALGLDPGEQLAELERGILRHDPALDLPNTNDGSSSASSTERRNSLLAQTATMSARHGTRPEIEGVTALLPLLAVAGSVNDAAQQRLAAIAAAERLGDPELTARVIGGFDVPGIWTRSDDPAQSEAIVDAALRTVAVLPSDASTRVRARLLATIAMESRGTATRTAEAAAAEHIARALGDPALLCFALSARFQQVFVTAGTAPTREAIGAEIITISLDAELPTFEIAGRLIRLQALCALDDIDAATDEAATLDGLAERFDRPLTSVFTGWFRWTFTAGPSPEPGEEMPGFRSGLADLANLATAIRAGDRLPDGDFGPYEPWVRPLLLCRAGRHHDAIAALDGVPNPPHDLMLEASWSLVGRAAIEMGHAAAARRAQLALLPAAAERAAGSGAIDLGPVSSTLTALSDLLDNGR